MFDLKLHAPYVRGDNPLLPLVIIRLLVSSNLFWFGGGPIYCDAKIMHVNNTIYDISCFWVTKWYDWVYCDL